MSLTESIYSLVVTLYSQYGHRIPAKLFHVLPSRKGTLKENERNPIYTE